MSFYSTLSLARANQISRYRVSPFTYLVDSFLSVGVANTDVTCADNELLNFAPPNGESCEQYMNPFMARMGGYLEDPSNTSECSFCTVATTNAFLAGINSSYGNRWRNFGIMWAYVIFNTAAALLLYWLVRVPKGPKKEKEPGAEPAEKAAEKTGKRGFGIFSKSKE